MTPLPLALTMGEPAGIGGETTAKAWRALRESGPAFVLIGDPAQCPDVPVTLIEAPEQAAAAFATALPILPRHLAAPLRLGTPDPANAPAVIGAIEEAVRLALAGRVGGIVTNPIQKAVLTAAGFRHPGHTEFLGELAGDGGPPVMMLACPGLRVVPVTIHVALAEALRSLTTAMIVEQGGIVAAALCMYHDQALIPIKTLDMDGGVNVTLGLRIIRTSPDHGTALDIAGQGLADPGSLIAALRLAGEMAASRARESTP